MVHQAHIAGQSLWAVAVTCIRASVVALYIRIFRTRSFRVTCYIVHCINVVFFVTAILAACLLCRPIARYWDLSVRGTCGDEVSTDLYLGIVNLLLDILIVILPMPVLWGLQMAVNKKVMLSGMFGLGLVYALAEELDSAFNHSRY